MVESVPHALVNLSNLWRFWRGITNVMRTLRFIQCSPIWVVKAVIQLWIGSVSPTQRLTIIGICPAIRQTPKLLML